MVSGTLNKAQSLPFLPGCVPSDLHKAQVRRTQTLAYKLSGDAVDKQKASISAERMDAILTQIADPLWRFKTNSGEKVLTGSERAELKESMRNTYRPAIQPAWLKHCRQVLRYDAYYQEKMEENPYENFRFRHCQILYYLEDGTMQVNEPRVENSGIPQGAFIKRHVIPHAEGGVIMPTDIKLGGLIEIYGKVFHVLKCDEFTKWFAKELGMELGEEQEPPEDLHTTRKDYLEKCAMGHFGIPRNVMEGKHYNELVLGGSRGNSGLEQFLKNDGKVLRFYSYWDDHTRYGIRQYQCIQYFLSDDSILISDRYPRNSGRAPFPTLFKRRRMEKNWKINAVPGMLQKDPIYVGPDDLKCGEFLEVLGRAYFLYDCDDFTKDFYDKFMGFEQKKYPKNVEDDPIIHHQLTPPPHNGPGTQEDSLINCMMLSPVPPKKDLVKMTTLDGKILRFEARCANYLVEDEERRFIIAYFLANDTVACFELRQRNSGFPDFPSFAKRTKKVNPATGVYYTPQDLFVGGEASISSMALALTRADEYTLKYMEENCQDYPVSNVQMILYKINPIKDDEEVRSVGNLDPDSFRNLVEQKTGVYLVDHELITLLRRFGETSDEPRLDMNLLLDAC
jgi:hypothetical protein